MAGPEKQNLSNDTSFNSNIRKSHSKQRDLFNQKYPSCSDIPRQTGLDGSSQLSAQRDLFNQKYPSDSGIPQQTDGYPAHHVELQYDPALDRWIPRSWPDSQTDPGKPSQPSECRDSFHKTFSRIFAYRDSFHETFNQKRLRQLVAEGETKLEANQETLMKAIPELEKILPIVDELVKWDVTQYLQDQSKKWKPEDPTARPNPLHSIYARVDSAETVKIELENHLTKLQEGQNFVNSIMDELSDVIPLLTIKNNEALQRKIRDDNTGRTTLSGGDLKNSQKNELEQPYLHHLMWFYHYTTKQPLQAFDQPTRSWRNIAKIKLSLIKYANPYIEKLNASIDETKKALQKATKTYNKLKDTLEAYRQSLQFQHLEAD